MLRTTLLLAFAILGAVPQDVSSQVPPVSQAPAARASDVASLDSILHALYDVISGPIGQRRNWDRMRSLFVPNARLIALGYPPTGVPVMRTFTVQQYIDTVGPRLEAGGFFEREIARRTERFGGVLHAFSTYESRRKAEDAVPFARGINSIQLWFDGQRWWVVTIYWEAERQANPIPPVYLESADRGTTSVARPARAPGVSDSSVVPLYVVDGRVSSASAVAAIDSTRIASVSVLKGAEAIATYGAAAHNGVVIITLVSP
jgi:TonB-dependent SusC/RagA subfamily outer membrane receptor